MRCRTFARLFGLGACALGVAAAFPGPDGGTSVSDSWPQFHGPRRDNVSRDRGLLKKWPAQGPRLLWKNSNCGRGYAGVSIAEGRVFTSGDFDRRERVVALDLDGRLLWTAPNGRAWTGAAPGARATPTYHAGVVYHMNATGRIAAYRATSGKELWGVDSEERFGVEYGAWALSENVVVDGNRVFSTPGGRRGRIVALDRRTGATVWANTEITEDAAYCSPIVVTHEGVRQLITLMRRSVVSVDVESGKLLWSHPHRTPYDLNVTRPVFKDGYVCVTSGYGAGARLLKIGPDSRSVEEVWANTDMDNCHAGVLLVEGRLYGNGCRQSRKGFVCLDFSTGETLWTDSAIEKASLTYADDLFYCLGHKGTMFLAAADSRHLAVVSQFPLPKQGKYDCLAHPVVCDGRLYLRQGTDLLVYDVRADSVGPRSPPED